MIHLKIEEFLKENGKSLYWLTVQTGRSYQSLKNLTKKDLYGIHFDTLEMLCRAFDCTPRRITRNDRWKGEWKKWAKF